MGCYMFIFQPGLIVTSVVIQLFSSATMKLLNLKNTLVYGPMLAMLAGLTTQSTVEFMLSLRELLAWLARLLRTGNLN